MTATIPETRELNRKQSRAHLDSLVRDATGLQSVAAFKRAYRKGELDLDDWKVIRLLVLAGLA